MTEDQFRSAIILDVVTTFVNRGAPLSRRDLVIKGKGLPAWKVIADLQGRNILRRSNPNSATEDEEYLPTAAAFELCGDPHLRERAKLATGIVLHALHQMFIREKKKEGFTFDDLDSQVDRMYPDRLFETSTLKLGLYLTKDFSVLTTYNSEPSGEVTRFQIGESAAGIADPDAEWDRVMALWLPSDRLTQQSSGTILEGEQEPEDEQMNKMNVFVIHGRDERLRAGMFTFLRSLGLNPMEWAYAVELSGSGSPYVGEILDAAFSHAQAVVVLLTPDDQVRLRPELCSPQEPDHETNFTHQARPNVLFESGMAMARHPKRTIMVEIGGLRPFSDVGGRHTIRMDNSPKKRHELAARLKNAECPVDLNGTDWLTAGDLSAPDLGLEANTTPATNPRLSAEAQQLLLAALEDPAGSVLCVDTSQGLVVSTNKKGFAESDNPRSQARWKAVVRELVTSGFLEPLGDKGEVLGMTDSGYETASRIRREQSGKSATI